MPIDQLQRMVAGARTRLSGVRIRSALAAAGVVAAAVGLAGVGLIVTARPILAGNADAAASQRAGQVATMVATGDPGRIASMLRSNASDQTVVQILDAAGRVVAASPELDGRPPITTLHPDAGVTEHEQRVIVPGDDDPFQIVAVGVPTAEGGGTVVVAQSLRAVNESAEFLTASVALGIPVLAAVVGMATFYFVSRTLRPVEAIRRRVSSISGRDLAARVPVPDTADEIAALARTMNAMLDRLESSAGTQRRFVADASHELRSPLTTLQVGLDVLAANPDIPAHQIRRLSAEAERLSRLVTDLLLLAQADEHALVDRPVEVDLDDLVYRHQERLQTAHPQLRVGLDLHPVRILGDPRQLERAIGNLADNAARHAHTRVVLAVRGEATDAVVIVADDGDGIEPADRQRVFDRFVRLDDSRTRSAGGSGLGLAIVREIVHRHGGTVTLDTAAHGGAQFEIRLPWIASTGPDAQHDHHQHHWNGGGPCESCSSRTRSSSPSPSAKA
jgi:signal transduction histidine kinase